MMNHLKIRYTNCNGAKQQRSNGCFNTKQIPSSNSNKFWKHMGTILENQMSHYQNLLNMHGGKAINPVPFDSWYI
ncbi:hypothetical protein SCA6_007542 [Theobroma cacao]